jgi:hypothetical protein
MEGETMTKYHYLLDPIAALSDNEKAATMQIARLKGVSVPDVLTEALRSYLHENTRWMQEEKQRQAALAEVVNAG